MKLTQRSKKKSCTRKCEKRKMWEPNQRTRSWLQVPKYTSTKRQRPRVHSHAHLHRIAENYITEMRRTLTKSSIKRRRDTYSTQSKYLTIFKPLATQTQRYRTGEQLCDIKARALDTTSLYRPCEHWPQIHIDSIACAQSNEIENRSHIKIPSLNACGKNTKPITKWRNRWY